MARVEGTGAPWAVPKDRAELLSRAWTNAAELYLQELVPRFDPWLQSALAELRRHSLPEGPLLVPCCGPGHELVMLHRLYGGQRAVYGLDLSQGMVDLATDAIAKYWMTHPQFHQAEEGMRSPPPLSGGAWGLASSAEPGAADPRVGAPLNAYVADASCIDSYGPAAAVLSVFGLQQMGPLAPQALTSWVRNLAPGGVAVVVLWPSTSDPGGPWEAFEQVVLERAADVAGKPPPEATAAAATPPAEWELRLTETALRDVPGAELLVDRLEQQCISWDSPAQLWKVMSEGGPWAARRLAQGDEVMSDLESRFLAKMDRAQGASGGETGASERQQQQQTQRRLDHRPSARLIVMSRRVTQTGQQQQQQQERQQERQQGQLQLQPSLQASL